METVIKKAIEGGWHPKLPFNFIWSEPTHIRVTNSVCAIFFGTKIKGAREENIIANISEIRENPLFWQALGKSLGWEGKMNLDNYFGVQTKPLWLYYWHQSIDQLASGKDAEEFFNLIIQNNARKN